MSLTERLQQELKLQRALLKAALVAPTTDPRTKQTFIRKRQRTIKALVAVLKEMKGVSMPSEDYSVIAESNGHKWVKPDWLKWQACLDCGIVRRGDDKNKPCPGSVKISLRERFGKSKQQ